MQVKRNTHFLKREVNKKKNYIYFNSRIADSILRMRGKYQ